jgi:ribonuclease P protein component
MSRPPSSASPAPRGAALDSLNAPARVRADPAPVRLDSLRGDREFRKVRQHGQVLRHRLFSLRVADYRPRYGEVWRPRAIIGIVVPKKTLKRAVDRNRARRRVREALRTLPGLPQCRAILMPAPSVLTVPFGELQAALAGALAQAAGRRRSEKARPPAASRPPAVDRQ